MKRVAAVLGCLALAAASASAQDAIVSRTGDGTVVVPSSDGAVTVTTRTQAQRVADRIPPKGVRLGEKRLEQFLEDRASRDSGWT